MVSVRVARTRRGDERFVAWDAANDGGCGK